MNTQTTQENKDQHSLIFDRQMRIEGWDQAALSKQVVLCLGVGGLGSCVAINLLRLGVKKIILIDYDKVDIHNLNRQVLYSKEDVGKYKIDAALKNLQMHNVGDTIIEGHNMDALKNWSKIVQMARECTAVINMIDWGEYFDVAVQALCLHLKLPFIMGGTFAASLSVDAFGPHAKPCFLCLTDGIKKDVLEKIMPDKIADIEDLTFLPKDNNPIGQSNIFLCNTCANFMTSMFINYTFKDPFVENPKRILFYVNSFESVIFPAEPSPNCVFCKSLEPIEPPKTEGEGESKPVDTEAETKADLNTEVPTEISHEGKTE